MCTFVAYRTKPQPRGEKIRHGCSGEKFNNPLSELRGKEPRADGCGSQAAAGLREVQTCTAGTLVGADRRNGRQFRIRRRKIASARPDRYVGGMVRPMQIDRADGRSSRSRVG